MSKRRILIVDDNPDTRELIGEQLANLDYELMFAENGQEAILKIGEQAPDIIVMDVMMPQLNGFEATRYLKIRYRKRFFPVVALTAKNDLASRRESARYGCDDYREKPYTKQQLLASVQGLLELSEAENEFLKTPDSETTQRKVINARYALAHRQAGEQTIHIARLHLARVLELSPEHEAARTLLGQLKDT